jgi:uncharacterized membrane protein YqjE
MSPTVTAAAVDPALTFSLVSLTALFVVGIAVNAIWQLKKSKSSN